MDSRITVKIKNNQIKSSKLVKYVTSLGLSENIDLYVYNKKIYINADIIFKILLVEPVWFIKNAMIKVHYIRISGNIYVNNYGIVKMLSQSKQQEAYQLQDYIFELIYQIESEEIAKNDPLIKKKLAETIAGIETYREIAEQKQSIIDDSYELIRELNVEKQQYITEIENLKDSVNSLTEEIKNANIELDTMKEIANKLAIYIKISVKNPPDFLNTSRLNIDDVNDDDADSKMEIMEDAKSAYMEFSKSNEKDALTLRKKIGKNIKKKTAEPKIMYYLHQSTNNDEKKSWMLSVEKPSDDYLEMSELYNLGDISNVNGGFIFYKSVLLTEDEKKNIDFILLITNGELTEETMLLVLKFYLQ